MLTTVRIWVLDHDVLLNESDVDYCKNNGIQLDAQQGEHQRVETSSGQVFHYRSSPGVIKLTTFDDKGECMLQLRYAGRIHLLQLIYTESVTHSY
jgi:NADH pyrophosphatase NudC (nudix superfamily)